MNPYNRAVASRAGFRCEYCQAPERAFNAAFDLDHITPVAHGGPTEPDNLALACRACNARKGDVTEATDPTTGEPAALYNPRADRWRDHFHIDSDSWEVIGTTPTGRATVTRLDLNAAFQLTARSLWVRFKLFP